MADDACRADVWLWRARFCKTRGQAARLVETGRVRLTRAGQETRLDKPSRALRPGDQLVFASGGRLTAVRVIAPGVRRGPPAEARGLYETVEGDAGRLLADLADAGEGLGEEGRDDAESDDPSSRH